MMQKKVKALSYINEIIDTTESIGDNELYLDEERNNCCVLQ